MSVASIEQASFNHFSGVMVTMESDRFSPMLDQTKDITSKLVFAASTEGLLQCRIIHHHSLICSCPGYVEIFSFQL